MAAEPTKLERTRRALRLEPFRAEYASAVASWVRNDYEARCVAPATNPPITAQRVIEWSGPGREPLLLWEAGGAGPLGYGELNKFHRRPADYWLGHLILDPARRGGGHGTTLTRLLLRRAFERYCAKRVTLVVVPQNEPAVACYRAAGMRTDGYETHHFPTRSGRVRLMRMAAIRAT